MPINNIATVHMSLLGLCFLSGDQKDILKREWDDRIDKDTALWVELDASSGFDQMRDAVLAAISERQGVIARNQCVMAAFLDFQQKISPELPEMLKKLQESMDLILNRNTNAILQFGYVGIRGLSDGQAARENAALFAEENAKRPASIQHRVCLVGSEFTRMSDENNWRAAAVMLDLLRRQNSIVGFLPTSPNGLANDDVGYLRYAEYDSVKHSKLLIEMQRIQQLQGNTGSQELFQLFGEQRNDLRAEVRSRFDITDKVFPLHPDLTVTGWINIRRATNGNYEPYNKAAESTRKALEQTAKRMEQGIREIFAQHISNAGQELQDMFEKAKVGLALKKDEAQMKTILNVTAPGAWPRVPALAYSQAGPSREIYEYLTAYRNYVAESCVAEYEDNIRKAYMALVEKGFEAEEQKLDEELSRVQNALSGMQTPQTIVRIAENGSFLPETGLTPQNVAGRQKCYVIFRGDNDMRKEMTTIAGSITTYEMKPFAHDPESMKNKPVKAVQMLVSDNSDPVLRSLINWG